ncbi:hypothetical protein [Burkholderia sp. Ac-20353]|uniref:hypothetical protein n=1 Tax=Burkholderia sp. Ac-20353 TaxID=2703894 RepID=UPI00197C7B05|nr:hypothetical protein [Burkholderia sp. Ac-20353]MBN3785556.1 hypothetical protein [Burkholderia sp. Ac-20353]
MSETLSALIGDVFSLAGWPGGNVAGLALKRLLDARLIRARDILFAELAAGEISPAAAASDESVAIVYRYLRSAQEGAARLNLRLLAGVFAGQIKGAAIAADEFLYYADILASLKRDEVILLGVMHRVWAQRPDDGNELTVPIVKDLQQAIINEVVPSVFATAEDVSATAGALQRTGLVAPMLPGFSFGKQPGVNYQPTNLLSKLNDLVEMEGVVARSENHENDREAGSDSQSGR